MRRGVVEAGMTSLNVRFFLTATLATLAFGAPVFSHAQDAAAGKTSTLIEGEKLQVARQAGKTHVQDMRAYGDGGWSGNAQLWWFEAKPGDVLEFTLPVAAAGTYRMGAGFTKAADYGVFDVSLDGKKLASALDFYNDGVVHSGTLALGETVALTAGEHRLAFTVTGANAKAAKKFMLGLDYVLLAGGDAKDLAALGPKLKAAPKPAPKANVKEGNALDAVARTPEEERAAFTVPEGFEIELVASEETGLPKAMTAVFDDAGRLWSQTATMYPRDNDPNIWKQPGTDRIVIIDHPCAKGPQTARTWADGMVMPLSVLPYGKGAFIAQGPEIFFMEDTDGDGKADTRKVLFKGYGVQDTHTLPHQLSLMPGHRIVYSQGVLNTGKATDSFGRTIDFSRTVIATFQPDGTGHEAIGIGMNNIWTWAVSREGRVFIHEANDFGFSVTPFEEDSTYPSFIQTKMHPAAPLHPPTAEGLNLGGTGFSGQAICDDRKGSYPAPWHGCIFVANPILNSIHAVSMELGENGVFTFKKAGDLVTCSDPMFRPVAITFGPDGCLYITDWYNRIISHNEVARDHPGRDKTRGRIWRVRHKSQTARIIPDMTRVPVAELPKHLTADNTWEMRAAWHQIAVRGGKATAPALAKIIRDAKTPDDTRIAALWAMEDIGNFDKALWKELLASKNPNVRRESIRAMSTLKVPAAEAFALLQPLADETAWTVRYEILRFFRRAGAAPDHVAWLRRWSEPVVEMRKVRGHFPLGGTYERAFQDFLLRLVTEKAPAPVANDPRWDQIIATQPARTAEETTAITKRIAAVKAAIAAAGDRPFDEGRNFVQTTCLTCHRIGDKGVSLAPPLDGSASRDLEGLITSIVDPDAAIETVFRLYRVEMKNGAKIEGFRKGLDEKQITIMSMGGGTQNIPLADIKAAGYVQGKSVMLPLAPGLTDTQLADIVRYLKTVK